MDYIVLLQCLTFLYATVDKDKIVKSPIKSGRTALTKEEFERLFPEDKEFLGQVKLDITKSFFEDHESSLPTEQLRDWGETKCPENSSASSDSFSETLQKEANRQSNETTKEASLVCDFCVFYYYFPFKSNSSELTNDPFVTPARICDENSTSHDSSHSCTIISDKCIGNESKKSDKYKQSNSMLSTVNKFSTSSSDLLFDTPKSQGPSHKMLLEKYLDVDVFYDAVQCESDFTEGN